jgi:RNA polymerase sigma factor (sigma-70 family)
VSIVTERAPAHEQAFADWVRPHLPAMARLAARLGPPADRDDIVQEALTRAWLKRDRYDGRRGTPSAWLLAITADQARKAGGRHWSRRWFSGSAGPAAVAARADDRLDLERALRRLTARQRLAVDCHYFVGLSTAETAAVMRCSGGTVKSTLADARAKLRTLLEVSE